MAKDQEEIEDTDLDTKTNSDNDDEQDADEDKDGSEDDDSSDDDSDDDDATPVTRKDLKAIDKKLDALATARRIGSGKRGITIKPGSDRKENDRLAAVEDWQRQQKQLERKREFGYQNGLSPTETDIVYRIEKRPTKDTLKDPVVIGALQGHRDAVAAKDNLPGSRGGRTFKVDNKEFKDLKPEEKRSSFSDRRRAILEGKKA